MPLLLLAQLAHPPALAAESCSTTSTTSSDVLVRLGWVPIPAKEKESSRNFNLYGLDSAATAVTFESPASGFTFNVVGDESGDKIFPSAGPGIAFDPSTCKYSTGKHLKLNKVSDKSDAERIVNVFEAIPQASVAGTFPYWTWMGDYAEALKHRQLSALAIPKTHDAGTYALSNTGTIGNLYKASVTQGRSIPQQLRDGIRMLDVRLSLDQNTKQLRVMHGKAGIYGERVDVVLDDIATFLASAPEELVFLELTQLYASDYASGVDYANSLILEDPKGLVLEHHTDLAVQIEETFGACLVPPTLSGYDGEGASLTFGDVGSWLDDNGCSGGGVVVLYTEREQHFRSVDDKEGEGVVKGVIEPFFAAHPALWGDCKYGGKCTSGSGGAGDDDTTVANKRADIQGYFDLAANDPSSGDWDVMRFHGFGGDVHYSSAWTFAGAVIGALPGDPEVASIEDLAASLNPGILGLLLEDFMAEPARTVGMDWYHLAETACEGSDCVGFVDHMVARNLGTFVTVGGSTLFELTGGYLYSQDQAEQVCRARGMQLASEATITSLYNDDGYNRCSWMWTSDDGVQVMPVQAGGASAGCGDAKLSVRTQAATAKSNGVCVAVNP